MMLSRGGLCVAPDIINLVRCYEAWLTRWAPLGNDCCNLPGLRREDLIMEEYPGVREALRRLPEDVIHVRNYRLARAIDLSMKHRILPESEWINTDEVYASGMSNDDSISTSFVS